MTDYPVVLGRNNENYNWSCSGDEEFFSDCDMHTAFSVDFWGDFCDHNDDLGVVCVVDPSANTLYPTGSLDIWDCETDDFTGYTTGGLVIYV